MATGVKAHCNVGMLKPDGTFAKQQVGPGVNPITMSADGRLFVGRIFLGAGLYELDPDLVAPPVERNPALLVNAFDFGPIPTNAIRHGGTLVAAQLGAGSVVNAEYPSEVLIDGMLVPLGRLLTAPHCMWATGGAVSSGP